VKSPVIVPESARSVPRSSLKVMRVGYAAHSKETSQVGRSCIMWDSCGIGTAGLETDIEGVWWLYALSQERVAAGGRPLETVAATSITDITGMEEKGMPSRVP